jgi:RNA 3'-terminal phosphate cyclase-like protein
MFPGLTGFEASFIRLLDKLTNGTHIEINEIGTSLFFRPGIVVGGSVEHDCGSGSSGGDNNQSAAAEGRSAGWFLEGVLPLAPFGKKPLHLTLSNCVTNDALDLSVDALKEVSLSVLRKFGVGADSETAALLDVSVRKRGALPLGGKVVC